MMSSVWQEESALNFINFCSKISHCYATLGNGSHKLVRAKCKQKKNNCSPANDNSQRFEWPCIVTEAGHQIDTKSLEWNNIFSLPFDQMYGLVLQLSIDEISDVILLSGSPSIWLKSGGDKSNKFHTKNFQLTCNQHFLARRAAKFVDSKWRSETIC